MKDDDRTNRFEASLRHVLERADDSLEEDIADRLVAARRSALTRPPTPAWRPASAPILIGVAMVILVLVLAWPRSVPLREPDLLQDIEVLSANEELDFYDDLEFYSWLASEADADQG